MALILDNGSTHAPKQLTRWIQERASTLEGKLTVQLYWLPTNASWLDQIEIWFSLLQRKLLQPKHFTSLNDAAAGHRRLYWLLQPDGQASRVVLHR
jgi:DDE superfamily endonuclease